MKGTPVWKRHAKKWVVRAEIKVVDVTDESREQPFHAMFSYTPSQPYSVFVDFDVHERWEFGRVLLDTPLYEKCSSGPGDVIIWPDGRRHVMMQLITGDICRRYRIRRRELSRFMRRALESVPRGSERDRLNFDFDNEIGYLLEQQA